jgi:hypothetical protein
MHLNGIVQSPSTNVDVEVDATLNDEYFDMHRDSIRVGLDRNSNRSLQDDPHVALSSTKCIRFAWSGVDEQGSLAIRTYVEPHRVKIPILFEWNQRIPVMAVLYRGGEAVRSNSSVLVFDRVRPTLESVRILGSHPSLLGLPAQVEVQINDENLSGGAMVEGGWSTTGELEFYDQMKVLPAVRRDRETWLLTLPTESMPSGKSNLLVRCRDRAGNVSSARSLTMPRRPHWFWAALRLGHCAKREYLFDCLKAPSRLSPLAPIPR